MLGSGRAPGRAALVSAVLVASCLALLGAPAEAAASPVVPFGTPSWWSGPCDANHWDPVARDDGWSGAGAHPLGASYLGVQVCGPRPAVDGAPDVEWTRGGWPELEWECVELAMRFMVLVYGVHPYSANGVDVVSDYTPADGGGLVKIQNGTPGEAPEPGDIVSFSDGGEGHVVVVTSSDVDAFGNGSITVMSQNDTSDGWRTLGVSDWTVEGFNIFTVLDWLHDPLGRGDPQAPPTPVDISLPRAGVGLEYGSSLVAVGGSGPYTWTIARGRLPSGFTLDASTGVISGVARSYGEDSFVVSVSSSTGASSTRRYGFVVGADPPPMVPVDFDDSLSVP